MQLKAGKKANQETAVSVLRAVKTNNSTMEAYEVTAVLVLLNQVKACMTTTVDEVDSSFDGGLLLTVLRIRAWTGHYLQLPPSSKDKVAQKSTITMSK